MSFESASHPPLLVLFFFFSFVIVSLLIDFLRFIFIYIHLNIPLYFFPRAIIHSLIHRIHSPLFPSFLYPPSALRPPLFKFQDSTSTSSSALVFFVHFVHHPPNNSLSVNLMTPSFLIILQPNVFHIIYIIIIPSSSSLMTHVSFCCSLYEGKVQRISLRIYFDI